MPPLVAAFFALQLLHAPNLLRSVLQDVNSAPSYQATPVTFTVTTAPWRDHMADRKGGCDFQLLARVTGRGPVRARIDSVEQLLDESWTPRYRLEAGKRATFEVEFLEPAGPEFGYTLAVRSTIFDCYKRDSRPAYLAPDMSHIP